MAGGIGESARSRLQNSSYFAHRDIGCAYQDRVLTLWGRLPSYYLKQMAQAMVAEVEGVATIVNQIEVMPPAQRARMGRGEGR